ncbi:MAG TPA: hypothetical protein PLZ51_17505, partial [Aggregatilineales bacterium]|nr:hypothetical protein [Aggregatilineales bacterium]
ALLAVTTAYDLDPEYGYVLAVRGEVNFALGNHESALADITQAMVLTPDDLMVRDVVGDLAEAYQGAGMCVEASAIANIGLEIDPLWDLLNSIKRA